MSPVGGVGINLAIQDAIAAANLLAGPFPGKAPLSDCVAKSLLPDFIWPMMSSTADSRRSSRLMGRLGLLALKGQVQYQGPTPDWQVRRHHDPIVPVCSRPWSHPRLLARIRRLV